MTSREKLIKLLLQYGMEREIAPDYADYLLANGVIVPPCKVGATLYSIKKFKSTGRKTVYSFTAPDIAWIIEHKSAFGKSIFLTREAAEKALEGKKIECL